MSNKAILAAVLFFGVVAGVQASEFNATQATLVREMLQIDADIAVINERQRLAEAMRKESATGSQQQQTILGEQIEPAIQIMKSADDVQILGIFGIVDQLYVDVSINGGRVRYKQGQARPEHAPTDFPYRLKSVNPPCATLMFNGKDLPLCIETRG